LPKSKLRQQKKPGRTPRPRRSKEEIIERLMEAACEEFEHNGYAGTTTAAIAQKASVAEWLIFTHFGSKAKLFHDSIFKPMNQQFVDFFNARLADAEDARQETARKYILELQRFIAHHSKMLSSLLFAQMYERDKVEGLGQVDGLHEYFSRAATMAMNRRSGKPKVDPTLLGRFSFATIMACVIFKDLLFPEGLATEDEISAGMTDFIMYGTRANANPIPKLETP
jgi:AcrR family transcriptional regulator